MIILCFFLNPTYAEESLSKNATAFYGLNDIDNALDTLLKVKEDERTSQDWLLLGNILLDKEKKSEAIFMFQRAIITEPKFYKPYYNLGLVYLDDERFYMAIDNFKLAIKYNPNFAYAHYNLGCCYLKIGETRKAKNEFVKAISIKNSEPDFYYNLAYAYKKLGKKKQAEFYLQNYNKLISGMVN